MPPHEPDRHAAALVRSEPFAAILARMLARPAAMTIASTGRLPDAETDSARRW